MAGLSAFLAQNAIRPENKKVAVSPRFVEDGAPALWEIRALTSGEDEAIRKQYMRMVQVPGKSGQYRQDFDTNGYMAAMAAACTVYPNLNDAALQDSYGVMGAEALLKTMLLSGEYMEYLRAIQEVNGFKGMDELTQDAKN